MSNRLIIIINTIFIMQFIGCSSEYSPGADRLGFSAPTRFTVEKNAKILEEMPFDDKEDYREAKKGFIASIPDLKIKDADGKYLWDMKSFSFVKGKAPGSVNPSLWRQAKLNSIHGLFKVTEGVYQIRGFDLSNMTIINGKTGWIIIDPLTTRETAEAAIAFARKHLKSKPIKAIIYTHSHIDHFGGVLGVIRPEDIKRKRIKIIAPKGFMEEATRENIIAGIAMGRRAEYQFGRHLHPSIRSYIDSGLGKRTPFGEFGILAPTDIIDRTPQKMMIDGVKFIFQYTPESEAPAELTFYLPHVKTFCGAEVITRNMHNLYTLRGAKIRDSQKWSSYIHEAIELFGDTEIYFASHHWPMWGNKRILNLLEKQRDLYKYIHDQTMRLANLGHTPREISEKLKLPKSLSNFFPNRGYYGTLSHNSKAVYQAYLGWFDGNPANLNPLAPSESAQKYVEYMGGAEKILTNAKKSFDKGDYRWVAEVLNHLVFAEPDNNKAKELLACTYDQLGYSAESGVWRNFYLSGAYELRHGVKEKGMDLAKVYEMLKRTPIPNLFDAMAVRLNGPKAEGKEMNINILFTDINESYVLTLKNSVLHHKKSPPYYKANVSLNVTHDLFVRLLTGKASIRETVFSDKLSINGSRIDLIKFFMLLDKPATNFNIVEP